MCDLFNLPRDNLVAGHRLFAPKLTKIPKIILTPNYLKTDLY